MLGFSLMNSLNSFSLTNCRVEVLRLALGTATFKLSVWPVVPTVEVAEERVVVGGEIGEIGVFVFPGKQVVLGGILSGIPSVHRSAVFRII